MRRRRRGRGKESVRRKDASLDWVGVVFGGWVAVSEGEKG
jgi:hypothetical protein